MICIVKDSQLALLITSICISQIFLIFCHLRWKRFLFMKWGMLVMQSERPWLIKNYLFIFLEALAGFRCYICLDYVFIAFKGVNARFG